MGSEIPQVLRKLQREMMAPITLQSLSRLPVASRFRELCLANAALDALLMAEWEYRYFSFNPNWGAGEQMASLRDGSGGHHFVLFCENGAFVKGFDPGSPLNTPFLGEIDDWRTADVPTGLRAALAEPAFDMEALSYCFWSTAPAAPWSTGVPPSDSLLDIPLGYLHLLVDEPAMYADWASEYYERQISQDTVRLFHQLVPLKAQMLGRLTDAAHIKEVTDELIEIGYPVREQT